MNIPNFQKDKDLNPEFQVFMDILTGQMQQNLSDNGFVPPAQNTSTITDLAPGMPAGTMWYDSEADAWKGRKKNGSIVTFQTS